MKIYHQLVFDDAVEGTTPVYTSPEWNELMATTEVIVVQVYATQTSGTNPTLTVRSQVSGDARTWTALSAAPEINLRALDTVNQTSLTGYSAATDPVSGFRRLEVTLGGTSPKSRLRIFVTGRQVVPATVPDFGTAHRITSTQSGVGANVNLDLNQAGLVRGIVYLGSGDWALNPGKTYLLRGEGRFENFSNTTAGKLEIRWVDDNNNVVGNIDPKAVCLPLTSTSAVSESPVVEVIYAVPADATIQQRTVRLRCVSATGTADIVPGAGWTATILEIPGG